MSLACGYLGLHVAIAYFKLGEWYRFPDLLAYWLTASAGSLLGFVGASCIHEGAHLLMARLVGANVIRVQIGSGKLLTRFRFLGTPVELKESLRSGLVAYSLLTAHRFRTRLFLITLFAPIASLFLAGMSLAFLLYIHPGEKRIPSIWHTFFPFLAGWTLPALLFLPGILLPFRYFFAGRSMQTDARALIPICRLTDYEISLKVVAACMLRDQSDQDI